MSEPWYLRFLLVYCPEPILGSEGDVDRASHGVPVIKDEPNVVSVAARSTTAAPEGASFMEGPTNDR